MNETNEEFNGGHRPKSLIGLIQDGLEKLSVDCDEATILRLGKYGSLLQKANKATRLVGRTGNEDIALHILDAAAILRLNIPEGALLDIGSGGGLPGIPLAILEPERTVCLLESRLRRATFLEHACLTLNLSNVDVKCARFEEVSFPDMKIAISRAVAPPDDFLKMLENFPGSHAIVMTNTRVFPIKDRGIWKVLNKDLPPVGGPPRHLNVLFEKT